MKSFSIFVFLVLPWAIFADEPYADPPMPKFRVVAKEFGASEADILAVLKSAGRELWRYFPDYKIEPFVVQKGEGSPIVMHDRNVRGEIVMRLPTEKTFWSQYAYQFGHEFCHILCKFDRDQSRSEWFEETLCETASLFVMRAMTKAWEHDAPYRNWVDYRHKLHGYAEDVIDNRIQIPKGGLADFYREHEAKLNESTTNRDLNGAVANVLLGWFEEDPTRWESVRWINSSPAPAGETFGAYLGKWHAAAPEKHQDFVKQIADAFEVGLDFTTPTAPPVDPTMPAFRVVAEGFGASEADIRAVLKSTGRELWRYFPDHQIEPFVVEHGNPGPTVLHQRNARGEIVMRLNTNKTFWSQYAYQFGQQFCRILCGFDGNQSPNKWLEEAFCETASLFALRAMAKSWENDPPYPNWADYRHSLRKYAENMIEERIEIPDGGLAEFYRENQAELAKSTTNRKLNGAVAIVLLGWLEEDPSSWDSVRWINSKPAAAGESLGAYLGSWHAAAPEKHRAFVKKIADAFEVELEVPK